MLGGVQKQLERQELAREPQALEAGGAGAQGSQWAVEAPAHPSTPGSATRQLRLQPGLPFPLPGRAGLALRQPQHVEPPRQSSDGEPGLLSNFAKGSSSPRLGAITRACQVRAVRWLPAHSKRALHTQAHLAGGGGGWGGAGGPALQRAGPALGISVGRDPTPSTAAAQPKDIVLAHTRTGRGLTHVPGSLGASRGVSMLRR